MKFSQIFTAPNQLTLLRMLFLPFIVMSLLDGYYRTALILFVLAGISDGLDGLLARRLHQQTALGQYLDPIADKLLLSTLFLVLSILHNIPWKYTVMVFSRDVAILVTSAVLYAISGLRNFSPSIFGKANTCAQIAAVFFVMLFQIYQTHSIWIARTVMLWATFLFTAISWVHYAFLVQTRLRGPHAAEARSHSGKQVA
jgi:cardiolipin synthase (CMP-forming)